MYPATENRCNANAQPRLKVDEHCHHPSTQRRLKKDANGLQRKRANGGIQVRVGVRTRLAEWLGLGLRYG